MLRRNLRGDIPSSARKTADEVRQVQANVERDFCDWLAAHGEPPGRLAQTRAHYQLMRRDPLSRFSIRCPMIVSNEATEAPPIPLVPSKIAGAIGAMHGCFNR
jgi:hypothetical protein